MYRYILSSLIISFFCNESVAQTGNLKGKVLDPSSKTISGALVNVILFNHRITATTTNQEGEYFIDRLAPNIHYVVSIEYGPFRTMMMEDIRVTADRTTFQDFYLKPKTKTDSSVDRQRCYIQTTGGRKGEKYDPKIWTECPKRYESLKCSICMTSKDVIPIVYGKLVIKPTQKPFVNFYPGGCAISDCRPRYYCKKDTLLF